MARARFPGVICGLSFSLGSPVFRPPLKPTLLNSNSIGNSRAIGPYRFVNRKTLEGERYLGWALIKLTGGGGGGGGD